MQAMNVYYERQNKVNYPEEKISAEEAGTFDGTVGRGSRAA